MQVDHFDRQFDVSSPTQTGPSSDNFMDDEFDQIMTSTNVSPSK